MRQPPTHPFPADLARGIALIEEVRQAGKTRRGTTTLTMTEEQFDLVLRFLEVGVTHVGLTWVKERGDANAESRS